MEKISVITEYIDILRTNVPFLIGLKLLDKHEMNVKNTPNRLVSEE